MEFKEIVKMPTTMHNTHESVLRSYQVLKVVKEMLQRNDSQTTILDYIDAVEDISNDYHNNNLTK